VAIQLAYHYSYANDKTKAVQYLRLAGKKGVGRGAVIEAERHYQSALRHIRELPHTIERDHLELELQMALGPVLWMAKSWSHPETERVFARAQELAAAFTEDTQLMAVLSGLFLSATGTGRYGLAKSLAERMLEVGKTSNSPSSLAMPILF
jgi:hypothetical protein